MPKTEEELKTLTAEIGALENELEELTDEELDEVTGGAFRRADNERHGRFFRGALFWALARNVGHAAKPAIALAEEYRADQP